MRSSEDDNTATIENLSLKLGEKYTLLAIAYFNLGCESEHLNQLEDSMDAYQRAKNLDLGRYGNHQLDK